MEHNTENNIILFACSSLIILDKWKKLIKPNSDFIVIDKRILKYLKSE